MLVINNKNQVVRTTKMGLELFVVIFKGVYAGQFASVQGANTKLLELDNKARS